MNYDTTDDMALFDMQGRRKYLTATEARRLLAVAAQGDDHIRLFCELLYCNRPAEAACRKVM